MYMVIGKLKNKCYQIINIGNGRGLKVVDMSIEGKMRVSNKWLEALKRIRKRSKNV